MSEQSFPIEPAHNPENSSSLVERYAAHPFSTLETYKYFNQKGAEAAQSRDDFVAASLDGVTPDAPRFIYPDIDVDQLLSQRDDLTAILDDFPIDRELSAIERLTRENVTNRIHEIGIMLLTKMQSEIDPNDPRYQTISFQLGQNMREVYGAPDADHFQGILGYRLSKLAEIKTRSDVPEAVTEAWAYVEQSFPISLPIEQPYEMKEETMDWYKAKLLERISPAIGAVREAIDEGFLKLTDRGSLKGEEIVAAIKISYQALGIVGWGADTTQETGIDTTQSHKMIYIPEDRELTLQQFEQIILGHEIDEHVCRRVNGDNTGITVLGGTGANGYLGWEEGNGRVNEGLLSGDTTTENSAFNYFLSGGLALGLEGEAAKPKNFGQTYDLTWRMNFIAGYLDHEHAGTRDDQIRYMKAAALGLYRLFRGTDGKVPGVVFTKDVMTYYPGQVQVLRKWDKDMLLSEDLRVREHARERVAKIDPTREDHKAIANSLV